MKKTLLFLMILASLVTACGGGRAATPVEATLPVLTLASPSPTATTEPTPSSTETHFVKVMYVGNAGFLITAGDKKILVDAIFKGLEGYSMPPAVQGLLFNAQPPFDAVDLILATHSHDDHFYAAQIIRYMQNNPHTVFVSTEDAARQVTGLGDRVIPIQLKGGESKQLTINGIGVEALYISHGTPSSGEPFLNLGYIIMVEGTKILHTGDLDPATVTTAYLQEYGLPDKQLDIAFVPHFVLLYKTAHPLVLQGIQARYVLPMHYAYTDPPVNYEQMAKYFPDAVVFHQEMESWVVPSVSAAPVSSTATSSSTLSTPAGGTIPPAVSIYSITFVVNGLEQVVRDDDTLQALPGDQVQVSEVTIGAGSFSGDGGEACVDFAPVDQSGQEIVSEHSGTHLVQVTTGLISIPGPSYTWTINENWRQFSVVLNHWPLEGTEDPGCASGRCERDDRIIVELR